MEFLFMLVIIGNSSVQDFFMEARNNFDDKNIPYQIWVKKLKNNPKNLLKSGKAGIDILSSGKTNAILFGPETIQLYPQYPCQVIAGKNNSGNYQMVIIFRDVCSRFKDL